MGVMPDLNMALKNQINNMAITPTVKKLGRSFVFNKDTKTFEFTNGRNTETTELIALEQWICLILITHKDKFNVYEDTDFYCDVEDLVGKKPIGFVLAQLRNEITIAVLKNELISDVQNFDTSYEKRILNVSFTVILKDNSILNINQNL